MKPRARLVRRTRVVIEPHEGCHWYGISEVLAHDADHLPGLAVELHRLTNNGWVSAESPGPQTIADHRYSSHTGKVVFFVDGSTHPRGYFKRREQAPGNGGRRDPYPRDLLWLMLILVESEPLSLSLGQVDRRKNGEESSAFSFSEAQLDAYGEYELQTLENVLRAGNAETQANVAQTIRGKIGWDWREDEEDGAFLNAYYSALSIRLERRMLFGNRRIDKFDTGESQNEG